MKPSDVSDKPLLLNLDNICLSLIVPVLLSIEMEEDSSGEEEVGEGGAVLPKVKVQYALSEGSRKTVLLANRRASARRAMHFAVGRLHGVLVEQRRYTRSAFQSTMVPVKTRQCYLVQHHHMQLLSHPGTTQQQTPSRRHTNS